MAFLDFLLSDSAKRHRAAVSLCLESGALQECPVCREVTGRNVSEKLLEQAQRLGDERLAQSDPRLAIFMGDKSSLHQSVREAAEKASFDCICERI